MAPSRNIDNDQGMESLQKVKSELKNGVSDTKLITRFGTGGDGRRTLLSYSRDCRLQLHTIECLHNGNTSVL